MLPKPPLPKTWATTSAQLGHRDRCPCYQRSDRLFYSEGDDIVVRFIFPDAIFSSLESGAMPYHFPTGRCANVEASYAERLQELAASYASDTIFSSLRDAERERLNEE